jgi:hypothetical protein
LNQESWKQCSTVNSTLAKTLPLDAVAGVHLGLKSATVTFTAQAL